MLLSELYTFTPWKRFRSGRLIINRRRRFYVNDPIGLHQPLKHKEEPPLRRADIKETSTSLHRGLMSGSHGPVAGVVVAGGLGM